MGELNRAREAVHAAFARGEGQDDELDVLVAVAMSHRQTTVDEAIDAVEQELADMSDQAEVIGRLVVKLIRKEIAYRTEGA